MIRAEDSRAEPKPSAPRANGFGIEGRRLPRLKGVISQHWHFALLGLVFGVLYAPVLKSLAADWVDDPDSLYALRSGESLSSLTRYSAPVASLVAKPTFATNTV